MRYRLLRLAACRSVLVVPGRAFASPQPFGDVCAHRIRRFTQLSDVKQSLRRRIDQAIHLVRNEISGLLNRNTTTFFHAVRCASIRRIPSRFYRATHPFIAVHCRRRFGSPFPSRCFGSPSGSQFWFALLVRLIGSPFSCYAEYLTPPPTTVCAILMSLILSGSTECGSSASMT